MAKKKKNLDTTDADALYDLLEREENLSPGPV